MFPIKDGLKQGSALSPLLFNFASKYAIRSVQDKQDGFKLNGTYQLLVYGEVYNHIETLVAASKQTGLEVNAYKTKYVVMSRYQNAGRSHNTD
jgi:hypothetical protein